MARYLQVYKGTLNWLFSNHAAVTAYAKWAGVSEDIAKTIRDQFAVKEDVNPDCVSGREQS